MLYGKLHRIRFARTDVNQSKLAIWVQAQPVYCLDGAWLTYEEYEAIQNQKVDLGVFDATIGFVDGDVRIFEHNNLNMVIEMKKTLSENIKRFCISHMAYTLHDEHEKLVRDMKKHNIDVAYDGMIIEF